MGSAPTVVHNANIYTADGAQPCATAFAVQNGHFLMVGSDEEVQSSFHNGLSIDAREHTIVPGFIDAHAHLHELGYTLQRVDLTGAQSPEAVVSRLTSAVDKADRTADAWLRGHGWDHTDWSPPTYPSRTPLDDAFPTRPVWLTRTDGHAGWANTAALDATVGLAPLHGMDNPEGGWIRRDDRGRPTGVLIDRAMALVTDRMPSPTAAKRDQALRTALDHAPRHGITGLHDAGVAFSEIQRFQQFIEEGRFPLRVYAMILGQSDTFPAFCEHGPLHHPSGRLDVASTKFFADGALGSRGAALLDDYADAPGNRGLLRDSPDAVRAQIQAAVMRGFQVSTHAIGDRAVRRVLDVYEAVARSDGPSLRRPRIEHAQVVAPADVARMRDLGVTASVQPTHAESDADWAGARLGPDRLARAYAWTPLHGAGVPLAFGSDAPVAPLGPLDAFAAAVTAQTTDDGHMLSPPLPRSVALHAHTLGAARAAGQTSTVGSITPGKRADFVVLSHDLMQISPVALADTTVLATYLDGHCVHAQPDWRDP